MSSPLPATADGTVSSLPPSIPLRREGAGADTMAPPGDVAWLVVAALMLAIALATWWGRRKRSSSLFGSGSGSWLSRLGLTDRPIQRDTVERISSTRLSPRHSLHVVVWDGRRLLIGCTDQSMRLISEAPSVQSAKPESAA
ncbi:flagellar biosynthetic protein FliO [Variovorax arabinosiphilus]|uniref:flagellar biosynthetic protein FliO n=1 Tax=Variovorax arabinosiphilus TaxID=3053498 RepID=UPI0025761FC7|nr:MULTISPECIES: flagellar biosynthetic protein FliO [unclassified Variovorax]MDM0122200.1 flagellar biosynthetic protein FliO [Variovorax sp. J2L1-78]MDM0131271.1 flagellar biosynthetic protein FliO [Variovorax sp. J2L1-63]MDM0234963.1 flagellar biosynthetic protein FliO [Variovorax sp. J2R1-6]